MKTLEERFYEKVMPEPNTGCWLWSGSLNNRGYARIHVDKKNKLASRVSFSMHNGKINDSLLVCHSCDTPSCVNPDHLFLGTHEDNLTDCVIKGRRPFTQNRLTIEDVLIIKERLKNGETQNSIAKDFCVHHVSIGNIKQGKTWKEKPTK